ncbi:thiamine pyrophosphate-binding protein [Micrococcus luteus]|uniref:thiamine pyrophosphate-binding protein n=1 Tax=Micrococcus luteus TaxID=1270 RepID=UPI0037A9C476
MPADPPVSPASAASAAPTVSEVVARVVADHTSEVFALMGNGNAFLTDALARQGRVRTTALRHEAGTVASADAYHRVSRRIAVATTTYGPGYTNALTALAEAAASRTPLVFVVGAEPTAGPRPWDVDQEAMATAAGALTLTVDAATPARTTTRAFALALAERRPVVLAIPYDLAQAPAADEPAAPVAVPPAALPVSDDAALARAVAALAGAERPLVLAGRGARAAAGELAALVDRLGALTASSAPARGTFAGRAYDLGVCGGFASEASGALIRRADVVLVVGAGLNQFTTAFGTQFAADAVVVQVDVAGAPTNPRVDVFLRADAGEAVAALAAALAGHATPARPWGGQAEEAAGSRTTFDRPAGDGQAPDGRLDPRSAMVELDRVLPADRQVISDGGHFIGWANYHLALPGPDRLTLVGTHFQAIGLGFPSAVGAVRARPEATAVVVTGDGGGLMGLPDLHTLVLAARSAAVIVFNDACYGAEIHQYGSRGVDEAVMEIPGVSFADLAPGLGARGVRVDTMAALAAVQEWVDAGAEGTIVVDLRISREVVAPYIEEIIALTLVK